ncbi:MAG: hypothetical protein OXH73_14100, partial [Caldilineaceae bacterium]|nr:hypothetical protein [Caldilineaceae bacterium]
MSISEYAGRRPFYSRGHSRVFRVPGTAPSHEWRPAGPVTLLPDYWVDMGSGGYGSGEGPALWTVVKVVELTRLLRLSSGP